MHFKQNNKESKSYVQGLRSFGNTLPRGIKGILKKNGYNYSEIVSKWNILVGKKISSYCFPKSIKMTSKNKEGILILSVHRGNEIDIEYEKKNIVNKVNSYFGYKLINEIRLKTYNSLSVKKNNKDNKKQFTKDFKYKIDKIKNEDLRQSLLQLLDLAKK